MRYLFVIYCQNAGISSVPVIARTTIVTNASETTTLVHFVSG